MNRMRGCGNRLPRTECRIGRIGGQLDRNLQVSRRAVEAGGARAKIQLHSEDASADGDIGQRLCRALLRASPDRLRVKDLELEIILTICRITAVCEFALISERCALGWDTQCCE